MQGKKESSLPVPSFLRSGSSDQTLSGSMAQGFLGGTGYLSTVGEVE